VRVVDVADHLGCTTGQVLAACDVLGIPADTGAQELSDVEAENIVDHMTSAPPPPPPSAEELLPPPSGEPAKLAAPTPGPASSPRFAARVSHVKVRRRRASPRALVGLCLVVAAGGYAYTQRNTVSIDALAIGQCVQVPADGEVTTLTTTSCSSPHGGYIYWDGDAPSDGTQYVDGNVPAIEFCVSQYVAAIGPIAADRDIAVISPTSAGWSAGDRGMTCVETTVDGSPLPPRP
jgi:hypothetical protein